MGLRWSKQQPRRLHDRTKQGQSSLTMSDEGKEGQTGATIEIQPLTEPAGKDGLVTRNEDSHEPIVSSSHEETVPNKRKRSVHFKLFGADINGETEDDNEVPAAKAIRTENQESPFVSNDNYFEDGYGNTEEAPFDATAITQCPRPFMEYFHFKPRPIPSSLDYHGTTGWGELAWDFSQWHCGFTTVQSQDSEYLDSTEIGEFLGEDAGPLYYGDSQVNLDTVPLDACDYLDEDYYGASDINLNTVPLEHSGCDVDLNEEHGGEFCCDYDSEIDSSYTAPAHTEVC